MIFLYLFISIFLELKFPIISQSLQLIGKINTLCEAWNSRVMEITSMKLSDSLAQIISADSSTNHLQTKDAHKRHYII